MNNQKNNFDRQMQDVILNLPPRENPYSVLLHSCCAPCSSSAILKLACFFKITVFYYNPNIDTAEEYFKRAEEQKHLISVYNNEKQIYNNKFPISVIEEKYFPEEFFEVSKGLENCAEGGERCMRCYFLRIKKTAKRAEAEGFDFFTTTLSLSPLKNAEKINAIGFSLSSEKSRWLPCDFKKRNGYLDSVKLSKELGLYRQDYCGCIYSKPQENFKV
ncbi:epoxyqueuosine reductase QueH [Treponema pedis]|uniref:epoxyqueuosine reductase QueH n=1 Tax=Treponema pedis TaxID=409322 RepID=UPI00040C30E4|nr:epoxyqueuosine reductase QueH [Treponema pedis]